MAAGWLAAEAASARPAVRCAGAVLIGAAQSLCSYPAPSGPAQSCAYRCELATAANQPQRVQGAFNLTSGASKVQNYQGAGFARALSPPIVLCQGRRGTP
jgi:pimeloyl-ACP methyl ester carboxylesterase